MKKIDFDSLIAAVAGFIIVYLFTHHSGVGTSPDSVVYTSVARNIYHHHILEAYNHMPLVDFPVFYPVFLSLWMFITRTDPVITGGILNGLLFAFVVFQSGYIMRRIARTRLSKIALLAGLVASPAMMDIYSMLWSETLFIALSLVMFRLLALYFGRPNLWAVTAMGICAGLACITRYAGITLICTGCFLLFFHLEHRMKKRITDTVVFGLVSSAFLIGNLCRNAAITHTLTGNREKGITPFMTNMHYYGKVLCYWLPFMKHVEWVATFLAVISLLIAILILTYRIYLQYNHGGFQNIVLAFFVIYTLFIVVSSTISRYEQINNRLLSPAYIPLLIVIVYALSKIKRRFVVYPGKYSLMPLTILFLVFMASQVTESMAMYHEYHTYGIPGYTDDGWKTSPIVDYLKKHQTSFISDYPVYSNAHEAAYFTAGIASASLPHVVDKEDVETFDSTASHYLIWFVNVNDTDLISLDYIRARKHMVPVYTTADGTLYWCSNKK